MASEPQTTPPPEGPAAPDFIETPRPTAAPLVLALGLVLLAAGVPFGVGFLVVGAVVVVAGVSLWIAQLLPGRGHVPEPLAGPERRRPVAAADPVERLRAGMPGYRLRLPQDVYPITAGIKGGIAGGLVMPLPGLLWGLLSGHRLWYPGNLLAGMVLPGVGKMDVAELEQFHAALLLVALVIHAVLSVVFGLLYGVLLPTLPKLRLVPGPMAWGGLVLPLLWTGTSYAFMGVVNPVLQERVDWLGFVVSQFVFGVAAAAVVLRSETVHIPPAGRGPDRATDFVAGESGGRS